MSDVITPVVFRLRSNRETRTAIVEAPAGAVFTVSAVDMLAVIARECGVSPADVELLGEWARRAARERAAQN